MTTFIEVRGAYGRRYKSLKDGKADWLAGKDFQLTDTGQYVSVSEAGSLSVILRYASDRRVGRLQ